VNTAQTVAEFDAGMTTPIKGPFSYNQLTGNVSFFTSHFSVFGVGGGGGSSSSGAVVAFDGGGCVINPNSGPVDPMLPAIVVLSLSYLGLCRRRAWKAGGGA